MDSERFHITLTKDAKPFCVNTPRKVPFAFPDKLKAELDLLQDQGVIAPVTEPTELCSHIIVMPKRHWQDQDVRRPVWPEQVRETWKVPVINPQPKR